jgi:hypothetical protein
MKLLLLLVEGQTEETFVRDVLAPYLAPSRIDCRPVIVATKRTGSGKRRGGVGSWSKVARELRLLLGNSHAHVSTIFDLYGWPDDAPGMSDILPSEASHSRAERLEAALGQYFGARHFTPHLVLHEFETWLYADPTRWTAALAAPATLANTLAAIAATAGGPELVDEGPETAPSKRLSKAWPGYRKLPHGPRAADLTTIEVIRAACPHFNRWIATLSNVSSSD